MVCLVSSLFAILLSVEPGGAVLPWAFGMTIASVALYERLRHFRPLLKISHTRG